MSRRGSTMSTAEAARILGVAVDAEWTEVRVAYREQIRSHHPDHAGAASADRAASIIEAFAVLERARAANDASATNVPPPQPPPSPPPRVRRTERWRPGVDPSPGVLRIDDGTLLIGAPADEVFRLLIDAAHDIGEVTYVDRSVPILEVLCQFVGEPATSLLLTLQGRATGTEVFCTVESIESRPAPPAASVVDLLELALHRRAQPGPIG